jgi:hypothetical protein
MPLLYSKGTDKAFKRLLEEIDKPLRAYDHRSMRTGYFLGIFRLRENAFRL